MKIKSLVIENFKSIERIELIEPNPFTVFVGPNGSGKSNIFEALEFVNISHHAPEYAESLFGGNERLLRKQGNPDFNFGADFEDFQLDWKANFSSVPITWDTSKPLFSFDDIEPDPPYGHPSYEQFYDNFSRIFVKNESLVKLRINSNQHLSLSASNLEPVLKRVLADNTLRNEIFEWLELFVPGFKAVEIDDRNELHWFEEFSPDYFTKDLISDGTYNILALLTAVYQSDDKPQFLCIEEPENGLHPQVAGELVDFFRIMCEERGHYIWLNTHSQSMASRVKPEELIVVDKKQGATRIKQISKNDFKNWRMDEAWLMNAFGGGLAW